MNKLKVLEEVLLMGPGPSCVPAEVYTALSRPTIGHLDPHFIDILDEIKVQLQTVMQTRNTLTIPMSGTGSSGMETCFVNLVEPGDRVLICINGVFGQRMEDLATRLGAEVETINFEWGTPVIPDVVRKKLEENEFTIVAVVHAETSTGVCNPVAEISEMLSGRKSLYLVDAVTSLGGMQVKTDEWKIDALYSGTQKCLSCPPGLAPISFSEKAVNKLMNRKTKVPNWYLDLTMIVNYWEGRKRAYHHTAPVNMLYGLFQALGNILDEGLENVFTRHKNCHELLVSSLADLGIDMLVDPVCRLPMLNAVKIPEGADEAAIRSSLLEKYKIEIGPGLGPLAGKIWRIGVMGHTARPENIDRLISALQKVL